MLPATIRTRRAPLRWWTPRAGSHTGDCRVDEDGYYFLTGRKKNVIILDSGENVSPEELEGLLAKCPAARSAW